MNSTELFLNPRTGRLRSGWRAAIFFALLNSPNLIYKLFPKREQAGMVAGIDLSGEMILIYVVLVAWVVAVSWFCLKFLEGMKLSALGFAPHSGWFGDVLKGCVTGALMISSVVMLQIIGGAQLNSNPIWLRGQGDDWRAGQMGGAGGIPRLVLLIF